MQQSVVQQQSMMTLVVADAALRVVGVTGEEQIGQAFRYAIEVNAADPDLERAVGKPAVLTLGERRIHGVVARVEVARASALIHLAPAMWLLSLGDKSRTFSGLSAPEIVEAVVASSGAPVAVARRLLDAYPARDWVVQYREDDLAFVSRLLEHAGIGWTLEHDGERELLVLCDHNDAYAQGSALGFGAELTAVRAESRMLPRSLVLLEHDPAMPELPLRAERLVDAQGFGVRVVHGEHFATPEEGEALALTRAEELLCKKRMLHGSAAAAMAAGRVVELTGHPRCDFNGRVLVTRVAIEAGLDGVAARFAALPMGARFRPERVTPRPRLSGMMHARVDAAGPGSDATVDERGRYRVQLPFELGDGAGAGCPMPMAQPYAGEDAGFQFTLPRGAGVVWSCIDGDPDRPVIAGAMPQRSEAAPARGHAIRAGGGIIELGPGRARRDGDVREGFLGADAAPAIPQAQSFGEEKLPSDVNTATGTNDTWMRFAVPHTKASDSDTGKWSYLRIGEPAQENPVAYAGHPNFLEKNSGDLALLQYDSDADMAGVFDYTDFNRTVITKLDKEERIDGEYQMTISGGQGEPVYDEHIGPNWIVDSNFVNQLELNQGFNFTIDSGLRSETFIGIHNENHIVGKLDLTIAASVACQLGYQLEFIHSDSVSWRRGEALRISQTEDVRANEKIEMSIDPALADDLSFKGEIIAGAAALIATAGLAGTSFAHCDAANIATTAAAGALYAGGIIAARMLDSGRELSNGDPFIGLNRNPTSNEHDLLLYCDEFRFYTTKTKDKLWIDDNARATPDQGRGDTLGAGIEIKTGKTLDDKTITIKCGAAEVIITNKLISLKGVDVEIEKNLKVTGNLEAINGQWVAQGPPLPMVNLPPPPPPLAPPPVAPPPLVTPPMVVSA